MDSIEVTFLCQGCQTTESVAQRLAAYIRQARQTIDIAIYSFSLCPGPHEIVAAALKERSDAGVKIRIAYDAGSQQAQMPNSFNDPCEIDTPDFIKSLGLPLKPIEGYRALMHDKYVILDDGTPDAQVWTGSTNWSEDSWDSEENNIVVLRSQELAHYYTNDFNELWEDGDIATSTDMDAAQVTLQYRGQPAGVQVYFSPAEGQEIDQVLANLIEGTTKKLTLASVVVTSSKILNALRSLMQRNVPLDGVFDGTQMEGVKYQWSMVPANNWKIPAWEEIVRYGNLVGKKSTPYTPTSKHDYMHNKVMIADDTVVTGSYNFSRHAQSNAENILVIGSPALAATYREYIYKIKDSFGAAQTNPTPAQQPEPEQQDPNI